MKKVLSFFITVLLVPFLILGYQEYSKKIILTFDYNGNNKIITKIKNNTPFDYIFNKSEITLLCYKYKSLKDADLIYVPSLKKVVVTGLQMDFNSYNNHFLKECKNTPILSGETNQCSLNIAKGDIVLSSFLFKHEYTLEPKIFNLFGLLSKTETRFYVYKNNKFHLKPKEYFEKNIKNKCFTFNGDTAILNNGKEVPVIESFLDEELKSANIKWNDK